MICEFCDQAKPDVTMRVDPFRSDLWGDDDPVPMCDDCERVRAEDL